MHRRGSQERFDFDAPVPLVMTPLAGGEVALAVRRVDFVDGEVLAFGSLSTTDFAAAAQRGCFHLDGEAPPDGWSQEVPVDLVLRLRRPVRQELGDAEAVLTALVGPSPTPLRATEAWFALEATQTVAVPGEPDATTSFGLRTRWADEPG